MELELIGAGGEGELILLNAQSETLGMDSTSISVKTESGESFRMDTPMRSVNGGELSAVAPTGIVWWLIQFEPFGQAPTREWLDYIVT